MSSRSTLLPLWAFLVFSIPAGAQNLALNLSGANYVQGDLGTEVVPSGGDFTVEFWAYIPSLISDGKNHKFVSEGIPTAAGSPAPFAGAFYIGYDPTGQIILGDQWLTPTGIQMPVGQWTHLALVFSGTTTFATFYLNGVKKLDYTGGYFYEDDGTAFDIGMEPGADESTPQEFMTGKMDELRVWNVARTAQQIKDGLFGTINAGDPTLLAWYEMNDGGGTLSNSSTSSSVDNNIPFTNGPSYTASPVQFGNNGLSFDGVTNQVVIPAASQYDLSTGTVEFWVNPTTLSGTFATVLGNRGAGGVRYSFHLSSSQIGIDNGSGTMLTLTPSPGQTIVDSVWTHLAFVNDGTQTAVYINGVPAGTIPGSFNNTVSGQPLTIGLAAAAPGGAGGEGPFAGSIDEVRVWNTQQTPTNILNNMGLTITGGAPGLVGQFSFDQGNPGHDNTGMVVALDATANNNHGLLTNFSLLATTPASNFNVHTLSDGPVILPIILTQFTATRQDNEALLQWETSQEENSASFVIERSSDGKSFSAIGTVAAAGNSSTPRDYTFSDLTPEKNNDFYRLRQTDLDGKFTYSPVRLLSFPSSGGLIWYSTGPKSVEVYLQQGSNERYALTDFGGRLLRLGQLANGKTELSGLPAGLYIVKVMTGTGLALETKVLLP
jgi:hypothetical protein